MRAKTAEDKIGIPGLENRLGRPGLTGAGKGKNILIVDDDESVGIGMTETLRDAGYAAQYVTSGQAAIEAVKKSHYSLVFMDIVMPVMDGLETFRRIKGFGTSPRVVLFTGFFKDAEKAILDGVRDGMIDMYIRKPFFAEEILQAAKRYA